MQIGFFPQFRRTALGTLLAHVKPRRTTRTALVKTIEKATLKIAHVAKLGGFLFHQFALKNHIVANEAALRRIV